MGDAHTAAAAALKVGLYKDFVPCTPERARHAYGTGLVADKRVACAPWRGTWHGTVAACAGETFTLSSTARKEVNSIKMYGNCGYMKARLQ